MAAVAATASSKPWMDVELFKIKKNCNKYDFEPSKHLCVIKFGDGTESNVPLAHKKIAVIKASLPKSVVSGHLCKGSHAVSQPHPDLKSIVINPHCFKEHKTHSVVLSYDLQQNVEAELPHRQIAFLVASLPKEAVDGELCRGKHAVKLAEHYLEKAYTKARASS